MTYAHHASRRVAHDMMEGDLIDVSLFGLVALQMFHLGISPSKQIYRWKSTFCGYACHRTGADVVFLPDSPLVAQREGESVYLV